jgi:hypothetical protein
MEYDIMLFKIAIIGSSVAVVLLLLVLLKLKGNLCQWMQNLLSAL